MTTPDQPDDLDRFIAEQLKDPEFAKAWDRAAMRDWRAAYERGVAEGLRLGEEIALKAFDKAGKVMWDGGVTEGRRQVTEGWDRAWGVEEGGVVERPQFRDERGARLIAAEEFSSVNVVSRLVGPWEPAEQAEDGAR